MDFANLSSTVIILSFLVAVLLMALIYHRFYPELFTRFLIRKKIAIYLYKKHYHLLEDVDISCADGQQFFIKQLLVSRYGLFIIDTSHYRGTIYGGHHQVKWLSKGLLHSIAFSNPHMELQPDIELLAKYLHLSPKLCQVLVVFTGNSQFPTPFPLNTCKLDNLIRTVVEHRTILINPRIIPDMISVLKIKNKNSDNGLKKLHGKA